MELVKRAETEDSAQPLRIFGPDRRAQEEA